MATVRNTWTNAPPCEPIAEGAAAVGDPLPETRIPDGLSYRTGDTLTISVAVNHVLGVRATQLTLADVDCRKLEIGGFDQASRRLPTIAPAMARRPQKSGASMF